MRVSCWTDRCVEWKGSVEVKYTEGSLVEALMERALNVTYTG
jgi:hypothetical protein